MNGKEARQQHVVGVNTASEKIPAGYFTYDKQGKQSKQGKQGKCSVSTST